MTGTDDINTETAKEGDNVTETENKTGAEKDGGPEKDPKSRSVSFNKDVHVKRFGKPRESRSSSTEPVVRKEPFDHLSEKELIEEANKVLAQASSVSCTTDRPPDKFFTLPSRKKNKEERERTSSDGDKGKSPLGRSNSDVGSKKRERTSISTLFRRAQKNKVSIPVVVTTKPVAVVKRSKSDVSDLKSNNELNPKSKPIRKRSGSETEEFLRSLRNKKAQLSPIIESSPRDDLFRKTPPLEVYQKQKLSIKDSLKSDDTNTCASDIKEDNINKVNPIEKPPRSEPKPPIRTKRGKSAEKDKESTPPISETPKRQTDIKKTILVDEIDSKLKDINPINVKERIKNSIRKIEDNIYGEKEMIHSSQKPPDKPPLTRGQTVDNIVRKLNEDQNSSPPMAHIIAPPSNGSNVNQPFSYFRPSKSPDPNLFARTTSPDRIPTPVNTMADKGVVYAHVVREPGDHGSNNFGKQTVHKTFTPPKDKYGNISDEDEGLGFEDRYKYSADRYNNNHKSEHDNFSSLEGLKITDSPIKPKFREYKLTSFDDFEPTYANEYTSTKDQTHDYIEAFRGRADGMDTKKKIEVENKMDLDFNELSHRRQLLESRLNTRRRNPGEPVSRYLAETDPIYEAEKRYKATEKYVNETARYMHHTLERDGLAESSIAENYNKYDSEGHNVQYDTEHKTFSRNLNDEIEKREFIDSMDPRYKGSLVIPPEPEYEPPSLEVRKPVHSPVEYKEKKYKVKKLFTSSQDVLHTKKYKGKDYYGERKGHHASNPEIAQEREDEYVNYSPQQGVTYHNSLRRTKNKDKYNRDLDDREYYRDDGSPRRFDFDNRLVDSGIENDFRKESSAEIQRKPLMYESDDDIRNTSLFITNEKQHTEENYPSEQIYANGEYTARFKGKEYRKGSRDSDEGSTLRPKDEKISSKPPKFKKLSGLEKVKQLFSRDSSKKSKKEKEVQQKSRTRVLESPERHEDDSDYRRYTDPEPSDMDVKKKDYDRGDRRYKSSREVDRYRSPDIKRNSSRTSRDNIRSPRDIYRSTRDDERGSRSEIRRSKDDVRGSLESIDRRRTRRDVERSKEDLNRYKDSKEDLRYRSPERRGSDLERKYRETEYNRRLERTEDRRVVERIEAKKYVPLGTRDGDSDPRGSDAESDRRKIRGGTATRLDSPALAERYRERRRLATPSPTPSPPPRAQLSSAGNWFKSLDRLSSKKKNKPTSTKIEEESVLTEGGTRNGWSKKSQHSPAKNLRFFGDTDPDQDSDVARTPVPKSRSHPHSTLRKTVSNSSTGLDEVDHSMNKSYSLNSLKETSESPRPRYYRNNLQTRKDRQREMSASETESQVDRRALKPPISPYDRSRSHSSSKTLTRSDQKRRERASSELRGSRQELSKQRRRGGAAPASGESSTEGESSLHSQRSVVYLHATTVGDIPDPGQLSRNRSRDDVSSVNSSNLQVRNTTKSFSIFAPWTPRHYSEQRDVHYAQRPRKPTKESSLKKFSSAKNLSDDRPPNLEKNKSYSQSTLSRKPQKSRLTGSIQTLYRNPEKRTPSVQNSNSNTLRKSVPRVKKSQSSDILNRSDSERERISRSISIPKDEKKAGWFKLSSKKKQENTRVR